MKTIYAGLALLAMVGFSNGYAQERTAGAALETQMTWTALKNEIDTLKAQVTGLDGKVTALDTKLTTLDGKVTGIDSKVARLMACASSGKLYAPGSAGVDANGCKDVSGGTRWVAVGSANVQGASGLFGNTNSSQYRRNLANAGYPECASSLRAGAKCPTANAQCAVISSYQDECRASGASDGDTRSCTKLTNTIYRCD